MVTLQAATVMATSLTGPAPSPAYPRQNSPADSGSWLSGTLPDSFFSDGGYDDALHLSGAPNNNFRSLLLPSATGKACKICSVPAQAILQLFFKLSRMLERGYMVGLLSCSLAIAVSSTGCPVLCMARFNPAERVLGCSPSIMSQPRSSAYLTPLETTAVLQSLCCRTTLMKRRCGPST